jgi:hypothetical protein
LAVTLCTITAYFAFWRLAPVTTFVVGVLALLGIVVFGWIMGGRDDLADVWIKHFRHLSATLNHFPLAFYPLHSDF